MFTFFEILPAIVAPLASKRYYQTLRDSDKVPVMQITFPYKLDPPYLTIFVAYGVLSGFSIFLLVFIFGSTFILDGAAYFYFFYILPPPSNLYLTVASLTISTP